MGCATSTAHSFCLAKTYWCALGGKLPSKAKNYSPPSGTIQEKGSKIKNDGGMSYAPKADGLVHELHRARAA